jgi:hypothetical protein
MGRAEDIFKEIITLGEEALDQFIINRRTEELFLDFKRANSEGKGNNTLHKDDRKNLAKAISGFGNSEGGVIVWGVDCSRDMEIGDVASAKVKVKNVRRFLSWLENAVSGCTVPPHKSVINRIISEDADGNGFIATLMPKSNFAPHMSALNNVYYIRSGSSTLPTPHSVLAGMFGRRPQPNVGLIFEQKSIDVVNNIDTSRKSGKNIENLPEKYVLIKFALQAFNDSNFIAKEIFITCNTQKTGGDESRVRFFNFGDMLAMQGVKNHLGLVSKDEFKFPPSGRINFATMELILTPPVTDHFLLEGVLGADNSPPKTFKLYVNSNDLSKIMNDAFTASGTDEFDDRYKRYLLDEFFKNLEVSE